MKIITATLVADGSSDKLLIPFIKLLFSEHAPADLAVRFNFAAGLPAIAEGLASRIRAALDLYPSDFLFVHRDEEGVGLMARQEEIERSWPADVQGTALICVIPIRMTEAWLLTNSKPIRLAVGNWNGNGTIPLELPTLKTIEASPNPKAVLFSALKTATMWNARRKESFRPDLYRHRVSELTDDLMPLRKLSSFNHLEAQVKKHLKLIE